MLEKLKRYKHYSKREKEGHLKSWQISGLSRKDYCEKYDINKSTFDSWVGKSNSKDSGKFLPVEVKGFSETRSSNYFLLKVGDLEIKLPINIEDNLLCRVIRETLKCI